MQSAENRRKKCHRFWLCLPRAVILISNDRTSTSKKINRMTLIRTLMVSTAAFERTKEKFYGFRQTVWFVILVLCIRGYYLDSSKLYHDIPVDIIYSI